MDVVERLRLRIHTSEDETALTDEAADEIERLREALKQITQKTLSDESWLSRSVDIRVIVHEALMVDE